MDCASPRRRVLLASTREGDPLVRRILGPLEVDVLSAFTHEEAIERIREGVDLVLCSLRFDESRMLDLLSEVGASVHHPPLLCCRLLDSDIRESSLHAAFTVAGHLGAAAVLDFPDLVRREGLARAEAALRESVAAQLHDIGHASMS
jgi:hypothetical protein